MVYRLVRNFILTNGKSRAFPLVYSKTPMLIPILLFVLSYAVLALVYVLAAIGAVWLRRRTERADLQQPHAHAHHLQRLAAQRREHLLQARRDRIPAGEA